MSMENLMFRYRERMKPARMKMRIANIGLKSVNVKIIENTCYQAARIHARSVSVQQMLQV